MFRRRLKDLCDKVFLQYYGTELGVDDNIESQVDYYRNISYKAEQLIGKSSLWHFGPEDAHVSVFPFYSVTIEKESTASRGKGVIWSIQELLPSVSTSTTDLPVGRYRLQNSFLTTFAPAFLSMPLQH